MPINMYRMVHTMGKRNPGGERGGLFIISKVFMPPPEISADKPPTANGITIASINCFVLEINNFTSAKSI